MNIIRNPHRLATYPHSIAPPPYATSPEAEKNAVTLPRCPGSMPCSTSVFIMGCRFACPAPYNSAANSNTARLFAWAIRKNGTTTITRLTAMITGCGNRISCGEITKRTTTVDSDATTKYVPTLAICNSTAYCAMKAVTPAAAQNTTNMIALGTTTLGRSSNANEPAPRCFAPPSAPDAPTVPVAFAGYWHTSPLPRTEATFSNRLSSSEIAVNATPTTNSAS